MRRDPWLPILLSAMVFGALIGSAPAETIFLRSGNGSVGGQDSFLTVLAGDPAVPFPALGTAEFDAADAGPPAWVTGQAAGSWIAALSCDPSAQWTGVDASASPKTALFAFPFTISSFPVSSAALEFCWAADDRLGDSALFPAGVYLNRVALPAISGGGFTFTSQAGPIDVTGLVDTGPNVLYVYNADEARVVSGALFLATLTVIPLCQASADGGADVVICEGESTTLSAALSTVLNCQEALQYRWTGPGLTGNWSSNADAAVAPGTTSSYLLEVRCPSEPACTSQDEVLVTVRECPTAVRFAWFGAKQVQDANTIGWETLAERDTLGFQVLRYTSLDPHGAAIESGFVPSHGPCKPYAVVDGHGNGTGVRYRIVEVTSSGTGNATPLFSPAAPRASRALQRSRAPESRGLP